jgi:pimeloyl-ACP methyl ester carboxylesterase
MQINKEEIAVNGQMVGLRRISGTPPDLILLSGAGGNYYYWDELLPHLEGRSVIIPAYPGRCESEGHPPKTVADLALWLAKLLDALGIQQPILVGHSLGGALSMQYALLEHTLPGPKVRGLALFSTSARLRVHPAIMEFIRTEVEAGRLPDFGPMPWRPETDTALIQRFEQSQSLTPPPALLGDWLLADSFDVTEQLAQITKPTLILVGSHDALTPMRAASLLASEIPNNRMAVINKVGHMLPVERAAETAQHLLAFINGRDAQIGRLYIRKFE